MKLQISLWERLQTEGRFQLIQQVALNFIRENLFLVTQLSQDLDSRKTVEMTEKK